MLWGPLHKRLSLFLTVIVSLSTVPVSLALSSIMTTTTTATSTDSTSTFPTQLLALQANSFASAHGIQVEKKNSDTDASYFECAPMSLLPNAYPRSAFTAAQNLAPAFNSLVDRISRCPEFLEDTLSGSVADADPYTAKLLEMYMDVYVNNPNAAAASADRLGIHRSDYMLNQGAIKQVELNTIASSFGGLASQVAVLHKYLTDRFGDDQAVCEFLQTNKRVVLNDEAAAYNAESDGVPSNPTLDRLPAAMAVAVDRYKQRFSPAVQPVILFVVQEGESNTVDQRMLEFRLYQDFQIPVVRLSLTAAHAAVHVDEATGALWYQGKEVAVVYYRAGYAPTDYPDGDDGIEWQARLTLEQSRATKAPSLGYHLAGTKKVQQELARAGVLERFFPDASEQNMVKDMRSAFAGLYSLGDDATDQDLQAVKDALSGGHGRYVLKPQREGGGYNYYGETLAAKLQENVVQSKDKMVLDKKLGEFILMERLFPPQQRAVLLRSGRVEGSGDSVSELGCFGAIVASPDGEVVHNEYAGFLLRTKFSNVDEGGVASGFATLSSPYLC